jgi:hypothetical protein
MTSAYSTHGKKMDVYRILAGRPERDKALGRSRSRGEDNIKMKLIGWGGVIAQSMLASQGRLSSLELGNYFRGSVSFVTKVTQ